VTPAQYLAVTVYFGTPLIIVWRWIVVGRRFGRVIVWPMFAALLLWLLQASTFAAALLYCISGHCNVSPTTEFLVTAVIVGAFIGILAMFVLSALRHRLP